MPRINRRDVLSDHEIQLVHCINRCVRECFLCGKDRQTGKDYSHRRRWIRDRIRYLASQMGIEILAYCVMTNHFHVVLRTRPDLVAEWDDAEVLRRWETLCPRNAIVSSNADPVQGRQEWLTERRRRLSSVSWFMKFVAEPVARAANREEKRKGRFWEGRFRCQLLLDETAVLACMQYVDLNPVRAAMAATPESSDFTSGQDRILDLQFHAQPPDTAQSASESRRHDRSEWLTRIPLDELSQTGTPAHRASDRGCLPMQLVDYLQLLDWTGRKLIDGKRGAIPEHIAPLLQRIGIHPKHWVSCVLQYGQLFGREVGRPSSMNASAMKQRRRNSRGIRASNKLFL